MLNDVRAICRRLPAAKRRYRSGEVGSGVWPALWLALAMVLTVSGPALAQVTADGTTVELTSAQATCSAAVCFEAKNSGTINSSGNKVTVIVDDGSPNGVFAHHLGTINLLDGGTITLGDAANGIVAGIQNSTSTADAGSITGNGLRLTSADGKAAGGGVLAWGPNSKITLNGETRLNGSLQLGFSASDGAAITVNGPVDATVTDTAIAQARTGRIDLLGGGNVTASGDFGFLFFAGVSSPGNSAGVLTMNGMATTVTGSTAVGAFFQTNGDATFEITKSTVAGTNSGGPLYGIWAQAGGNSSVMLDNSQLTLGSAGRGVFVDGQTTTVTLVNGSAITAHGDNAPDSLAYVTNFPGLGSFPAGAGSLTLNATDSMLTGNMLVDAPGAQGANTLAANLHGTTQWTGNLTVNGASTGSVLLTDTAHWTGAALNATNVALQGGGTTWTMTDNSSITGTLTNGGTVAFQPGGAFHSLTTTNYVGNGGTLSINTQLGADNSPTDQLIIKGGLASGTTGIVVTNVGGLGAQTDDKGIPIVVTTAGASSTPTAFHLTGGSVSAGKYAYLLFQGPGAAGGNTDDATSWFLRSHVEGSNGQPDQPLYRGETAMHSLYGVMARQLGMLTLGTFHERNGDQRLADTGGRERTWARVFGQHMEQSHAGDVRPSFEGNFVGLQGGIDLWQFASLPGHRDNVGVFAAFAEGRANVSGFILATPNKFAGRTDFDASSVGAYWSHIAPTGWYTDAVLMGTIYDGDGRTFDSSRVGVDGSGVIASLEGGFTVARFAGLKLEQQAQLVYQYINLDEAHDPHAHVAHRTPDALHGRIGLRLAADSLPWLLKPYLKANIWQDFVGSDRTVYDHTQDIVLRHEATTLELGAGFTAQIAPNVALWASADWSTDIAGEEQERESIRGNADLRITW